MEEPLDLELILDGRELSTNFKMILQDLFGSMDNISDVLNKTTGGHKHPIPSTVEMFRVAAPAALTIDRVVTPIWYIIGIIGNPITMKIWLSKKSWTSNSSAIYIGSIAIVQFIFIILHFFMELHVAWDVSTYNKPGICEVFNFLYISPQYLSPMLILGFTVERYIAVCHPFKKEKYCTVKRATIVVIVLTIVALLLGSVQAYVWAYDESRDMCRIKKSLKRFYTIWTWMSEILIFAIVPLSVLVFNILVIRDIRRLSNTVPCLANEKRMHRSANQTSTRTLLCVSFYLICTLLPATIVYSVQSQVRNGDQRLPLEKWPDDPTWSRYMKYLTVRKVVEEICFSNYACYVFIYYITGKYFRKECRRLFCSRCRKETEKSQSVKSNGGTTGGYTLVSNGAIEMIAMSDRKCS